MIDLRFRRWPVHGLTTVSAIFDGENTRGVYILEFLNDEFYVGQAKDVRKRFAQHCTDTGHHAAWRDIMWLSFAPGAGPELTLREVETIHGLLQEGKQLRNRSHNLFHDQPSPLDVLISPVDQFHWADGSSLDREPSRTPTRDIEQAIAELPSATSKMTRLDGAHHHLRDIAAFIDLVIPEPLQTLEKYWTISDCPSTNRGRYYTVNVGVLEMLWRPRAAAASHLNTMRWSELEGGKWWRIELGASAGHVEAVNTRYPKAEVTHVEFESGHLGAVLEGSPEILAHARALAVALMRTGTAGMFRRWHSRPLAREALMELWESRDDR